MFNEEREECGKINKRMFDEGRKKCKKEKGETNIICWKWKNRETQVITGHA